MTTLHLPGVYAPGQMKQDHSDIARDGLILALWDEKNRVLTLVDGARGSTVITVPLPQVDELQLVKDGAHAGELFAVSHDGRVVRLTPKISATKAEPATKAPSDVAETTKP